MRNKILLPLGLCLISSILEAETTPPLGLTTNDQGILLKAGQPYHGVGVNYFDPFYRLLLNPEDPSYEEGFKDLAQREIPFIRFMACGFWPVDWKLYQQDREDYFSRLDKVIRSAEKHKIGLIPSLFWHQPTLSDLAGEHYNAWGDPKSRTLDLMRTYVKEVVSRYKDSPAIWGWELANEMNLQSDLPNASDHRPWVNTKLGTIPVRDERDEITLEVVQVAVSEFAQEVRKYDPHRIIFSGHAAMRPSAWNFWKHKTWDSDTYEQHYEIVSLNNPDPCDSLTIHLYLENGINYFGAPQTFHDIIKAYMEYSQKLKKPLFIGEFGAKEVPDTEGPHQTKMVFNEILKAIVDHRVPLSALWVYDYDKQDDEWNVTGTNSRAYQLEAIQEANRKLGTISQPNQ